MGGKNGLSYAVIALAALLFSASRAARAQVGQWTSGGLSDAFGSVTVDPSDPWRLYVTSFSGALLTSDDGGAHWLDVGPPLHSTPEVAVSSSRLGTLYAFDFGSGGSQPRLFRSRDNGVSWSPTAYAGGGDYLATVRVDPSIASTVYVGTDRVLSRSRDGGTTWEELKLRENATRRIYDILFPPRDPSTVYVLDADYSYYPQFTVDKTSDGGKTWKTVVDGPGLLVLDPFDSSHLYGVGCPNAFRSGDAGATWTSFYIPVDLCNFSALVADPVRRNYLYGSRWYGGVMRSRDGGNTWESLSAGTLGNVSALAIDPAGIFLHATTSRGVYTLQLAETRASPCEADSERLCLLGGRFEVSVKYGDVPARAVPQGDRFGSFRRPGDEPTDPEIFVKMADRRAFPNRAVWFFHTSVTDLGYTITVRDTSTGHLRFYRNEPANRGCGAADTGAFLERSAGDGEGVEELGAGSSLSPGETETLSLMGGRFEVTLSVRNPFTGAIDTGLAMPQTDRLGYFSFPTVTGDPAFPEVFVAVEPGAFQMTFAHTGLTNLPYTLRIRDTLTGVERVSGNDGHDVFNLCGGFESIVTD